MTARVRSPGVATRRSRRARLADVEETLASLRAGEADAIVVSGPGGEQVYTLSGTDRIYRRLIESLAEGTVTIDADGTVLHCNSAFAAMLGRPVDEVTHTSVRAHVTPAGQGAVDAALALACGMHLRQEVDLVRGDGGSVPVSLSAVAVEGERDMPLTCVIVTDVTAQKQAEAELARRVAERTTQLQAANRELEAFSYSVSHDLRAPLRAIDGYSRILLEDHAERLGDDGRRTIDVVRHEVQRMDRLISDLLALSRLGRQVVDMAELDMTALAGAALDEVLANAAGRVVNVTLPALPAAYGTATMILQVWVNLLANAVKFTRHCEQPAIVVGGSADAVGVTYFVRDNGAGFDMRFADRLFQPFQRFHSENEFEGTGIGLAIVHRIVSRHGGRVWAEGQPGAGATFYFTLPGPV